MASELTKAMAPASEIAVAKKTLDEEAALTGVAGRAATSATKAAAADKEARAWAAAARDTSKVATAAAPHSTAAIAKPKVITANSTSGRRLDFVHVPTGGSALATHLGADVVAENDQLSNQSGLGGAAGMIIDDVEVMQLGFRPAAHQTPDSTSMPSVLVGSERDRREPLRGMMRPPELTPERASQPHVAHTLHPRGYTPLPSLPPLSTTANTSTVAASRLEPGLYPQPREHVPAEMLQLEDPATASALAHLSSFASARSTQWEAYAMSYARRKLGGEGHGASFSSVYGSSTYDSSKRGSEPARNGSNVVGEGSSFGVGGIIGGLPAGGAGLLSGGGGSRRAISLSVNADVDAEGMSRALAAPAGSLAAARAAAQNGDPYAEMRRPRLTVSYPPLRPPALEAPRLKTHSARVPAPPRAPKGDGSRSARVGRHVQRESAGKAAPLTSRTAVHPIRELPPRLVKNARLVEAMAYASSRVRVVF